MAVEDTDSLLTGARSRLSSDSRTRNSVWAAFLLLAILGLTIFCISSNPGWVEVAQQESDFFKAVSLAADHPTINVTNPHLKAVLKGCGDICRHDIPGTPGLFFDYVEKEVNCPAILSNAAIDAGRDTPEPLPNIPDDMLEWFTYGGKVDVRSWMFNQVYLNGEASVNKWTVEEIENQKVQCLAGTLKGTYGVLVTNNVLKGLQSMGLTNASVLVIGSERPWLEACALAAGAGHVTTLEYGHIESSHPQISTLTPADMRAQASQSIERFDAVLSFSSIEHSGLGRYGDAMNPWGDRQTVARAWCMTKKGGKLGIGVEQAKDGNDVIFYNAHRVYGKIMYPHLLANWKQVARFPGSQDFLVLQK
jgi:hypothetical protein